MRGVLQLFHKHSKDLFWNCSRTKLPDYKHNEILKRCILSSVYRLLSKGSFNQVFVVFFMDNWASLCHYCQLWKPVKRVIYDE